MITPSTTQVIQQSMDAALAGGTLTSPLWIQAVTEGLQIYVLIGGAVLLTLRVVTVLQDLRKKHNQKEIGKKS